MDPMLAVATSTNPPSSRANSVRKDRFFRRIMKATDCFGPPAPSLPHRSSLTEMAAGRISFRRPDGVGPAGSTLKFAGRDLRPGAGASRSLVLGLRPATLRQAGRARFPGAPGSADPGRYGPGKDIARAEPGLRHRRHGTAAG